MFLGAAFITNASLGYFDPDAFEPFVVEKLPQVRFTDLGLASLKVHVAAALVSFPACLALMTRWVQRRKKLHRYLGRLTGLLVVLALVPSGFILAFDAKGGVNVTIGFILSGAIVLSGMVAGVLAARRKDMSGHARAMKHVVAQMSVAVTSRAMLVSFAYFEFDPGAAYVAALWIPVIASALVAERVSGGLRLSQLPLKTHTAKTT